MADEVFVMLGCERAGSHWIDLVVGGWVGGEEGADSW